MDPPDKKIRGNLAYQERQQRRRHFLDKKQAMRQVFQMGKLVQKVGLEGEEMNVIYGLLLEAKKKLLSGETETRRENWRVKVKDMTVEKI